MFMVYIELDHEQVSLVLQLGVTSFSRNKPICSWEGYLGFTGSMYKRQMTDGL